MQTRPTAPPAGRIPALAFAAALAAMVVLAGLLAPAAAAKPPRGKGAPNIVLFQTDDQARSTVLPEAMPNLHELLISGGTTFSDYVVTTPLCCPSRATILTGQYGHNNGVLRNSYSDLKQKRNVLPVWLRRAGYTTAHVGKFLHGYERTRRNPAAVAPGWDRWFTQLAPRRYYRWKASVNGKLRSHGQRNRDHATAVTNDVAARWTKKMARERKPFYLQFDTFAPHRGGGRGGGRCRGAPKPMPKDAGRFRSTPLPEPPNFNEEDVSDKPGYVAKLPQLDAGAIDRITDRYRCTLESLRSADRGIRDVYKEVKRAGELNRTVFVFASDNGYFYGEHRIPKGKPSLAPYEESIHMPLTIVVPKKYRSGARRLSTSDAAVANIDLAATMLDLAGGEPCQTRRRCRIMDGRSLMPLLERDSGFPANRPIGIEVGECTYRGVRVDDEIYFEFSRPGEQGCAPDAFEFYDLAADPFQLENLAPAPPDSGLEGRERKLNRLAARIRDCAGIRGRDPAPRSGSYCR